MTDAERPREELELRRVPHVHAAADTRIPREHVHDEQRCEHPTMRDGARYAGAFEPGVGLGRHLDETLELGDDVSTRGAGWLRAPAYWPAFGSMMRPRKTSVLV